MLIYLIQKYLKILILIILNLKINKKKTILKKILNTNINN
mgnify:CR=1 FL=1